MYIYIWHDMMYNTEYSVEIQMKRADRLSTSLIIFPSSCGPNTHEIEETEKMGCQCIWWHILLVEMSPIPLNPSGEAALHALHEFSHWIGGP